MTKRGAAPEARDLGAADSTGAAAGHRADSVANLPLPAHVLEALAEEHVYTLTDWRRLGKRRWSIFGVTPKVVELLDAAAREAAR